MSDPNPPGRSRATAEPSFEELLGGSAASSAGGGYGDESPTTSELDALFAGGHGAPAIPPAPDRPATRRELREAEAGAAAQTAAARNAAAQTAAAQNEAAQNAAAQRDAAQTPAAETSTPVSAADALGGDAGALAAAASVASSTGARRGAGGSGSGSGGSGSGGGRRSRRQASPYGKPPRKSRRGLWGGLIAVGIFLALVAVAVVIFLEPVKALLAGPESDDYVGNGTGEVTFTIHEGDLGSDIANNLVSDGVIKTYQPFYDLLVIQDPEPIFQPGAYKMAQKMSAASALDTLLDPTTRLANTFVIPEGTALVDALPLIADGTGLSVDDLTAASTDLASFGLPAGATTLEGFLFPATYELAEGITAHDALQTLVNRMYQALDEAGVPVEDRLRVVIFASLVQREAGLADDFPKVARVFQNRLDQNMLLQSDATVAYGTGNTHLVTTTDAERADANNPYNTYQHLGLPPAAISNPGDLAINAVMHPAEGTWLFFVTVNLDTGETVFSTTIEEHDAAVATWQAWMADHPEYG